MNKVSLIAALVAMLATACGGNAELPSVSSTDGAGAISSIENPTTAPPETERPSTTEPDDAGFAEDGQLLEVEVVEPSKGAEESGDTVPPPVTGDGAVPPSVTGHTNPQVATAIADLVDRAGVDVSVIEVVSVDEVTWPDGSVGCPLPGMRYTQALVNGSRIILRAEGVQFQYNSGGGLGPFYCANPSDPVPGEGDYGDI